MLEPVRQSQQPGTEGAQTGAAWAMENTGTPLAIRMTTAVKRMRATLRSINVNIVSLLTTSDSTRRVRRPGKRLNLPAHEILNGHQSDLFVQVQTGLT
jgi:hypothetical protein